MSASPPSAVPASPNNPGRKVALLDLDGTLSDSEPGILGSLVEAMEANRVAVPPVTLLRTAIGPPFATGLPAIGVPADKLEPVIAHYRRVYDAGGLFDTTLYAGVGELLDELRRAGLVLGVATSKPEHNAVRILDHLGVADRFQAIAGADLDLGRSEKAAVIERALDLLGVDAGPEVIMIGDRRHDIEGAAVHGIDTIAVGWGYGSAEEHAEAGAWATAESPRDVVRFVLGV